MATTTALDKEGPRRYGNYRRPTRPGPLGFSLLTSLLAFAGVTFAILVILAGGGIVAGSALIALTLIALAPARRAKKDGRSGYERLWKRVANGHNRRQSRHAMYSGPVGFTPDGKCRLPGLLTASELITAYDSHQQPFGVLYLPSTSHYTVVFECAATGQELNDQSVIDQEVAHWGQFLAELGEWTDVDGAQVVVETAPDPGDRLAAMVQERRVEGAPAFASEVTDALVAEYPVGSSMISTRVALTFSGRLMAEDGKSRSMDRTEMLARIGNRIPTIVAAMRVTGAGQSVRPMKAQDITDAVRVAFDPEVAPLVEQHRREHGGTDLAWEEAGPVQWKPFEDAVHHDRAWSTSFQLLEPPRGAVYADILTQLLAPHPDITRKRVAMLYRPHDSVSAAETVERDVNETQFVASSKRRPTARARADVRAAQQSSDEEASGAGLVRFGMVITATVDRKEDLPRARASIRQLTGSARLRIREVLGNQEVAFTASLPCGLVLPKHMRVPSDTLDLL